MIDISDVSKKFDGKREVVALKAVDLHIAKGEMVSIDGAKLSGLSDDELTRVRRDKSGFVFQFFHLLPTLTCRENVALPLHLRGWSRKQVQARAD